MLRPVRTLLFVLLLNLSSALFAQEKVELSGIVRGEHGSKLELATVNIKDLSGGSITDVNGRFRLAVSRQDTLVLQIRCLGYEPFSRIIIPAEHANPREIYLQIQMTQRLENISEAVVRGQTDRGANLQRIDHRIAQVLPDASGSFEGIVKKQMGVSSGNELSSQYSVRGGNFDENLVYVNDIKIYRPFLIRAGQQEGLSFVNPDMVSSVLFSAGGFDARYGDKMSSVLDIRYKKPTTFAGSGSMSMMGGSLHFEGSSKNRNLSYITGVRYKTNKFLLNTLDTQGDYNPRFFDFQTYLSYDLTTDWEIDFLGNVAMNNYRFVPQSGETAFGTPHEALKVSIFFDGMEEDAFNTYLGALSSRYHPTDNFELKFVASAFQTQERETYDILGAYYLNQLDKDLGSDNFSDSLVNLGYGAFLEHARNQLKANVFNGTHKGFWILGKNQLNWGLEYQKSFIQDQIDEWIMNDSAGYSLPYSDSEVNLYHVYKAGSQIDHQQVTGYLQNTFKTDFKSGSEMRLTTGIRASYLDINNDYFISPRIGFAFVPNWKQDWSFRFSTGGYHQPPFFKEFRDLKGNFNPNVSAQKSMHALGGTDYYFDYWGRPFKFVAELYYKYFWDLVPYELGNVRIRYFGDNLSNGYAAGLDLKVAGEFVPGVDSWANVSIMKTQEDIQGDTLGFINRPTDQRVNVALFFQDYIPNNKSYKAHLNLLFGTGLPWGPPGDPNQKSAFNYPPYRRVDLGFSKVLIGEKAQANLPGPLKYLTNTWISIEIFNLVDINNTISHVWIRDISGNQYSVPTYLTGRRINVKLLTRF